MGGQRPRQVRRLVDQIKAKMSMFDKEQVYFIEGAEVEIDSSSLCRALYRILQVHNRAKAAAGLTCGYGCNAPVSTFKTETLLFRRRHRYCTVSHNNQAILEQIIV